MDSQYAGIIYSSLLSASTHLKVFIYRIGRPGRTIPSLAGGMVRPGRPMLLNARIFVSDYVRGLSLLGDK